MKLYPSTVGSFFRHINRSRSSPWCISTLTGAPACLLDIVNSILLTDPGFRSAADGWARRASGCPLRMNTYPDESPALQISSAALREVLSSLTEGAVSPFDTVCRDASGMGRIMTNTRRTNRDEGRSEAHSLVLLNTPCVLGWWRACRTLSGSWR